MSRLQALRRRTTLALAALAAVLLAAPFAAAQDQPAESRPAAPAAGLEATPNPAPSMAAPAAADTRPDFSGRWQLDPRASDDPARMGQGQRPGGGPGGGMGGGPGGGMGRGGGGMGRGGGPSVDPSSGTMPGEGFDGSGDAARERQEAAGRQSAREFGLLEIFHAGDELDLTDGMQISRSLRIGGDPVEVFTPRGSVKAAAAWDGDTLVLTERDPRGEVRRTRQLILGADGNTLTVKEIHHMPGKGGNQVMTMVYRRQDDPGKR